MQRDEDLPDLINARNQTSGGEEEGNKPCGSDTTESSHAWTSSPQSKECDTEEEAEVVFVVDHRADTKWMAKGDYRPVRDALKAIEDVMRQEGKDRKKATKPVLEGADARKKRKPGPWRIVEIFACTMLAWLAASASW